MSTISSVGVVPYYSLAPASAAAQAIAQLTADPVAASVGDAAAQQTTTSAAPLTGSSAAPPLSSAVLGALIDEQAQQSTGASSAVAAAGAASTPLTLQQIADEFDVHHLTADQAAQLREDLVKSGALSSNDARHLFIINATSGESFGHWDGHTLTGPNVVTPPAGSTFDETQLVQTWLKSDQSSGNTKNVSAEQDILNVLNSLDQLSPNRTA